MSMSTVPRPQLMDIRVTNTFQKTHSIKPHKVVLHACIDTETIVR